MPLGRVKIRRGGIISKCENKYGCWGIWGICDNQGCVFLRRVVIYNILGYLGIYWDVLYSMDALWEDFWGSFQRRCLIVLVYPILLIEIDFYALADIMGEIGLLLVGWYRQTVQTRWDVVGMEGPELVVAVSEAPPLSLEVRRSKVSSGCHQLHQCCRWRGIFLSVHQ